MISKNRHCILHNAGGILPCVSYSKMLYNGNSLPYRPLQVGAIFTRLSLLNVIINLTKRLPAAVGRPFRPCSVKPSDIRYY